MRTEVASCRLTEREGAKLRRLSVRWDMTPSETLRLLLRAVDERARPETVFRGAYRDERPALDVVGEL